MSEENKQQEMQKKEETKRNSRGEIGPGTPGKRLKALWQESGRHVSLKAFVRGLKDNADAKRWLGSKLGKFNEKRSEKNAVAAKAAAQASKAARSKKK